MAGGVPGVAMVPVERAELVTKDMDLIAELIRDLHVEHEAAFSCPDPARVDGRVRSVTARGLTAALVRYGGFEYSAEVEPVNRRWPSCALGIPVSSRPHAKTSA